MTRLTTHFTLEEFQKHEPIPASCIGIFTEMRRRSSSRSARSSTRALIITSGYRSAQENALPSVHGQPNSEHIATTWPAPAILK